MTSFIASISIDVEADGRDHEGAALKALEYIESFLNNGVTIVVHVDGIPIYVEWDDDYCKWVVQPDEPEVVQLPLPLD